MRLPRVAAVADQAAFFPQISCASEQLRFPCEEPKACQRTSIQDREISCSYPKELIERPDQGGQERVAELCRSGQLLLLCGRSGRADNRDFESNRWQWKDGAWSH